jgi:hypothetical protein
MVCNDSGNGQGSDADGCNDPSSDQDSEGASDEVEEEELDLNSTDWCSSIFMVIRMILFLDTRCLT